MNRTEELLKLRPKIKTIKQDLNTSSIELFQNGTIRPILKFQHEILLAIFYTAIAKNKIPFSSLKQEEKEITLDELFQKNLSFKNQSIGAIIGIFSREEFAHYIEDSSAYNRRIITMLKQRILSTY